MRYFLYGMDGCPWRSERTVEIMTPPHPRTSLFLTPGTCGYVKLYGIRGIKVSDEIKLAKELSLMEEDYSGLSRWVQCNHNGP